MYRYSTQLCLSFLLLVVLIAGDDNKLYKTIETENGLIRGIRMNTLLQKEDYFAYRGIRYAEPPVDELRFKVPKPIASWKPAVLDAFEYGSACIHQSKMFSNPEIEDEDCLFLNLFVPENIKENEKLAVMFFIHGGGYIEGSGDGVFFGADFLIEQRVILVTVNYRLGALGFLSLDTPEYSGNMGLKDQQLALKWIHTNIGNFGGDNKRITVFGHSAGGASTHFHMLSSESRKYFHNAIPMSGSIENPWAMSKQNDHVAAMFDVAEKLGEPKKTFEELLNFLKTASVDTIRKGFPSMELAHTIELFWTPVIERSDAVQPFIFDESNKNSVSSMFGFTSEESLMLASSFDPSIFNDPKTNIIFPFRNMNIPLDSKKYRSLVNEIQAFYTKDGKDLLNEFINLESDINFAYGIDKAVRIQVTKSSSDTFYYRFSVDSILNVLKLKQQVAIDGSSHGDELCYLFKCQFMQPFYEKILSNKDDKDSQISLKTINNITKLFSNFAKYGTPSRNGKPIDGIKPIQNEKAHFIDITNEGLIVSVNPNEKTNEFWRYIEENANKLAQEQKREEL